MKKAKILIVDDDVNFLDVIASALSGDYDVKTAVDGKEAWENIEQFDFNLVVTDLQMPNMSGADLIAKIRREKPDLPVILSTSFLLSEIRFDLADTHYLNKPYSLDSLLSKIEVLLKVSEVSPLPQLIP